MMKLCYPVLVLASLLSGLNLLAAGPVEGARLAENEPTAQRGVANDETFFNFEKQESGAVPLHWGRVSGRGDWKITREFSASGANAVRFSRPDSLDRDVSVCVVQPDHVRYTNVDLSVGIQLGQAHPGTGGGVVWNYQDEQNFYSAVLQENGVVEVFRTREGKTTRLVSAPSRLVVQADWSTLRVIHQAQEITVFVNDGRVVAVRDESVLTGGKVGLVSSAHELGVDNFRVKTAARPYKTSADR